MQRGILAGLDRASCNAGLHGSTLRLITFDDAYLPARTSSNMRQLIEKDHILVDALEGLGEFDLGLGEPLRLSRTEHQASHHVWPTLLKGGQFAPFQWSDIGTLVNGEPPR